MHVPGKLKLPIDNTVIFYMLVNEQVYRAIIKTSFGKVI